MDKCLLRVDEAAMRLSVSRWTIYRWVQEGRLDATKIGKGSLRIFQTSVAALIEQNRTWDAGVSKSHRIP
ncbi:helix-turn-helix domain-containing protein [Candidatus Methylomirabilis sp.]|uniref:helix-turn-helix domain-containing protein n=1 Tax=Candidatus Methylomirabilis sp. TaxID=2032687 RepID=UPI003C74E0BD